jgi:glycine cleavage system H protein
MASDLLFTKDHEWVRVEGDVATIGITAYAADQLGDVVFVELPEAGRRVKKGDAAAVVESVKAASDVYSPLTGEVVEANAAIVGSPEKVNESPEAEAWFMRLRIADRSELDSMLDDDAYRAFIATL